MKTNKELKEDYKSMKPEMGVFQIRNISNGKVFVANGLNMGAKWNRYTTQLKFGIHFNKELQKDWNEKGEANFVFEVLSVLKYSDKEGGDYQAELETLQDMVVEDMGVRKENLY
ncbi:GIY-YIG nuclease family protein [Patescibacteria group bacterium]|nr:GIY-YIG nuclease family protein [Patescibacteria group bacterium]